ncbi:MAG TPA: cell division topological specificity factor MinE [Cyanobacteria bacterium UBA8156]|nr:cell division topological specificity factor MinE [Cyanobacteria bacterium UBA8156]
MTNAIADLLERLFGGKTESRDRVKQRLKFILAHDRVALTPQLVEQMRQDILTAIAKYVEIDEEGVEFGLESDRRSTVVIANLPIRGLRYFDPNVAQLELTLPEPPGSKVTSFDSAPAVEGEG